LCVPVLVGAAVGGSLAGFAQAGIHIQTSMLGFRPERLNPLPKLQNMVDPKHALIETVMSLLRVGAVGFVGYRVVMLEVPRIIRLAGMPLNDGVPIVIEIVVRVVMWVLGALAVVAAADWAQSKIVLERSLKMSRQEIMDEQKSEDGDPKVKARMRQRARAMARKRAMNAVKDASVVVTNPTHVSVALRYREGDPAPIVVAKGHDEVAMEIRVRARQHGIPIIESRALARALDKEVRVGQPVPAAHYAAVAKVLAFVFRLKGRRPGPSPRQRVSGSSATSR
jgi:flagellar biosynthetic protein FlhB